MQRQPETVTKLQSERRHLIRKTELLRSRPDLRNRISRDTGLDQRDGVIQPFAALLVSVVLDRRCAPNIERTVIAGPIALIRLQDIEERLIARTQDAVGKIVRM